ncbi:hypothetical protein LCGC14_0570860 [marine sediment metagenome]|uniref:Uncharacterized protein n=1 Tax=marine sediment metagenome TaxID=412755 RepID=A0A0F9RPB5_9ZZZZ
MLELRIGLTRQALKLSSAQFQFQFRNTNTALLKVGLVIGEERAQALD